MRKNNTIELGSKIRVDSELLGKLQKASLALKAQGLDVSYSNLIRKALEDWLNAFLSGGIQIGITTKWNK